MCQGLFLLKNQPSLSLYLIIVATYSATCFLSVFFSNEGRLYLIRVEGVKGFFTKKNFGRQTRIELPSTSTPHAKQKAIWLIPNDPFTKANNRTTQDLKNRHTKRGVPAGKTSRSGSDIYRHRPSPSLLDQAPCFAVEGNEDSIAHQNSGPAGSED